VKEKDSFCQSLVCIYPFEEFTLNGRILCSREATLDLDRAAICKQLLIYALSPVWIQRVIRCGALAEVIPPPKKKHRVPDVAKAAA
jgi:hypothetical protein